MSGDAWQLQLLWQEVAACAEAFGGVRQDGALPRRQLWEGLWVTVAGTALPQSLGEPQTDEVPVLGVNSFPAVLERHEPVWPGTSRRGKSGVPPVALLSLCTQAQQEAAYTGP